MDPYWGRGLKQLIPQAATGEFEIPVFLHSVLDADLHAPEQGLTWKPSTVAKSTFKRVSRPQRAEKAERNCSTCDLYGDRTATLPISAA